MRYFRIVVHTIALFFLLTFYVLPTLMIPFVNQLPYLHSLTIWQRLIISSAFFSLIFLVIIFFAKPEAKRMASGLMKTKIDAFGAMLGFLLFIYAGASHSANILGLLVMHTVQNSPCIYKVEVLKADFQGSKHKSIFLTLRSETDGKTYYLTLAKKLFDYPRIEAGNKMILKGQQNVFGVYVEKFEME